MSINFHTQEVDELRPRIVVIGVGGAGGNAVTNMIASQLQGVDFVVANTDAQALNSSAATARLQLGLKITQGLGAGAKPEVGRAAAEEALVDVEKALEGAHMCFVAAGMGGGTGTGAAPIIAKAARDKGILTVGVVTKPFGFEGARRTRAAEAGIAELQKHVDTLIVIPNQNLFLVANANTTFKEAFLMADQVLQQGVRSITDLIVMPGLINLDFADIRSVMGEMGKAMMGTGEASGDNRAIDAAKLAIANPLLDGVSLNGAKGVIISITGGDDLRLMELEEAANHIKEMVDPDANIIWGSAFSDALEGKIRVSVVATGIEADAMRAPEPARVFAFPNVKKEEPKAVSNSFKPDYLANMTPISKRKENERTPQAAPVQTMPETMTAEQKTAERHDLVAEIEAIAQQETDHAPVSHHAASNGELLLDDTQALHTETEATPTVAPMTFQDETKSAFQVEVPHTQVAEPRAIEPAPRIAQGGGTLFERMSTIARGNARAAPHIAPGTGEMPEIPGFLSSQNNQ